jgi:hypothetical protein
MRFKDLMLVKAEELTCQGWVVLMPFSVQADQESDLKSMLDKMHFQKIDMSTSIHIVTDSTGYIGDSTKREISYAANHGKTLFGIDDVFLGSPRDISCIHPGHPDACRYPSHRHPSTEDFPA